MKHYEQAKRSWVKTISYRVLIIIATLIAVFIITGDVAITVDVTIITSMVNTLLYFVHERVWNKIHWGKTE